MFSAHRFAVKIPIIFLAACVCLQASCNAITLLTTTTASPAIIITPSLTPSPSETPYVMCTPPYCWEDEVYHCPGVCPGGCGTMCATRTPDPQASPTPTFPALSSLCVLPTPDPSQSGAHIALCVSAETVHLGDTLQLAAEFIGAADFNYINILGQDVDGTGNFSSRARSGNYQPQLYSNNAHLNVVRLQTEGERLFALLEAVSLGTTQITFRAIPTVPDVQTSITITVLP